MTALFPEVPLGRSVQLINEKASASDFKVALENIESWTGKLIPGEPSEYEGEGIAFAPGDVIFGKLRPYLAKALAVESPGAAVGDFWVMRPSNYTPAFLTYLLLNRVFIDLVDGATYGSKMPRVSWDFGRNVPLPRPDIASQVAITSFLDRETAQIDALIAKQQELIETLAERRKSVITRAVTLGVREEVNLVPTTKPTVEYIPESWKLNKLRSLAIVISKGTTPSTIGAEYQDSGVRFLRGEDLVGGEVISTAPIFISHETDEVLSRSRLQAGDILFVIAGTLGKIGVVQPEILPANTNQAIAFIRLKDKGLVKFVSYWLQSRNVEELTSLMAVTAAQPNLSMQNLGNFPVPLPPVDEISEILNYLDESLAKTDSLVTNASKMIEVLQERRQALISAAVTGKIDVRGK